MRRNKNTNPPGEKGNPPPGGTNHQVNKMIEGTEGTDITASVPTPQNVNENTAQSFTTINVNQTVSGKPVSEFAHDVHVGGIDFDAFNALHAEGLRLQEQYVSTGAIPKNTLQDFAHTHFGIPQLHDDDVTMQSQQSEPPNNTQGGDREKASSDTHNESNDTNKSKSNDIQVRTRIYPPTFEGNLIVYIREHLEPLKHVTISRYLLNTYKSAVTEVYKVHEKKIRVQAANIATANLIVADKNLSKYRVSIPADAVEVNGVVSISEDLSMKELIEFGTGVFGHAGLLRVNITDAYRMRRSFTNLDGSVGYANSDQVRVTFQGTALPKFLEIYGLRSPVRLYRPKIMFCEKCQGFNHTSKYCASPKRCSKCGDQHETAACKEGPKCLHCSENVAHPKQSDCPEFQKRTKILNRKVSTRSKQAYTGLVNKVSGNIYDSLSEEDLSDGDDLVTEGATWAQMASRKRPLRNAIKGANPTPPKRMAGVEKSAKPNSVKDTTTRQNKDNKQNKDRQPRTPKTDNQKQDGPFPDDWMISLRVAILNSIDAFELSPFWANLAKNIVTRLLDTFLPRISSSFLNLFSSFSL